MLRFIEHFFCGSRYWFSGTKICGCFGRLVTVTAATERLLKALRGDPFCGGLLGIFYGFRGVTLQFNSQKEELARNRCRRLVRDSLKISTFEAYNKVLVKKR